MKKFKFPLETLKKVREREEDSQKAELALKRLELSKLNDELAKVINLRSDEQKKLVEKAVKGMTSEDYFIHHNYLDKLKEQISILKSKINFLNNEIEELLNKLIETKRSIKILSTLKDKKYQEYLKEANLEESKIIEEFISTTKVAKSSEVYYE